METRKQLSTAAVFLLTAGILIQAWAANTDRTGTAGAEELLIPMGARGTALGGGASAMIDGVDAIYWNPAGLSNSKHGVETLFSYMKYIADINITYGAISVKTRLGSFGFSCQTMSFGDIPITTETAPDGTGSFYSPTYITIGATFSCAMTGRIHAGMNAKLISEKIVNCSASAVGFDLGVQYLSDFGVKLGIVLKNFGGPIRFDGSDLERLVELPDTPAGAPPRRLRIVTQKEELPSCFEIGLAYEIRPMGKMSIIFLGDFRSNNFMSDQLIGGAEVCFNQLFFVRAAYDHAMNEEKDTAGKSTYLFGPSFGFGVVHPFSSAMKVAFDFAYRTTEYFNDNLIFTARLLF